ncbi:hypothetical protein [Serratia quinivorans]|jgi:hypothetical protein|uniref:hypothetical protein n=1 Tax=Serratia quinivorans TaxID=137545 RepID=UPI00217A04B7|nr:hypothetical protein [Serratia quinivorans]CAI0831611.1 Uncharacterized membrane protein yohP [Serratia quinivorans]CAI2066600.1 Uncharacterized membrane protein yohP [Serratia quinivorans]
MQQAIYETSATVNNDFIRLAKARAIIQTYRERRMKIILWIVAIIFIVGLLTITGVFKLIF